MKSVIKRASAIIMALMVFTVSLVPQQARATVIPYYILAHLAPTQVYVTLWRDGTMNVLQPGYFYTLQDGDRLHIEFPDCQPTARIGVLIGIQDPGTGQNSNVQLGVPGGCKAQDWTFSVPTPPSPVVITQAGNWCPCGGPH